MADPKNGAPHKDAPAPAYVTAVVAHGRSVIKDGSRYLPGAAIELPTDEAARLVALGFLHDPNAAVIESGIGPTYSPETARIVRPQ